MIVRANKGGSTIVTNSKEVEIIRGQFIVYEGETLEDAKKRIKDCKHEYDNFCRCKFCGSKMTEEEKIEEQRQILGDPNWKRDFKIPENLEQINQQEWDEIWEEWEGILAKWKAHDARDMQFFEWLEQNYNAPEKK